MKFPIRLGLASIAVCCLLGSLAARADDDDKDKKPAYPIVGNDDIFGFTTASELGDAGDTEFSNENDGRIGKRGGSYGALNSKYEFSYNISSEWWVAASGFLAYNRVKNVLISPDKNTFEFDGLSFEVAHRLLARSETNPWGITASIEPRWGRIDGESGFRSENYGFGAKLFIDRVIIPEKMFWAANLQWAPTWAKDPFMANNNLINSQTLVSTALSWQVAPGVYLGGEARYLAEFARIIPDHVIGQALYVGPTLLWKVTDKIAVNATFQPQVWGRAESTPGQALDLDNFERAMFRLKLAWQLN